MGGLPDRQETGCLADKWHSIPGDASVRCRGAGSKPEIYERICVELWAVVVSFYPDYLAFMPAYGGWAALGGRAQMDPVSLPYVLRHA
ncbi:hypothetical protein D3C73_1125090 [compost metagenome]